MQTADRQAWTGGGDADIGNAGQTAKLTASETE